MDSRFLVVFRFVVIAVFLLYYTEQCNFVLCVVSFYITLPSVILIRLKYKPKIQMKIKEYVNALSRGAQKR